MPALGAGDAWTAPDSLQLGVPSEVSATSDVEAVSAGQVASASAHMTEMAASHVRVWQAWGYKSPGAQGSIAAPVRVSVTSLQSAAR